MKEKFMAEKSKYLEQFERVERWYQRFKEINDGKLHDRYTEYYKDEVYAFFINCFHLKDWIKYDKSVGNANNIVEEFVKNNTDLNLCRDICHGIKHLELKNPKSGKDPKFGKRDYAINSAGIINIKYTINLKDGPIDAFELATRCLKVWEEFIQINIKKNM
jgi:hypothetical protein